MIFFISSFFSILARHSCQVPHDSSNESLSPIIILPAPSEISYESLHYPVPAEQQYQVIPLVINTGKIPLINHAVQAPIQYFVPDNDNRRAPIYDSAQYPTARDERLQLRRNPDTSILYSNDAQTENRPNRDDHDNYPPAATATVYSETRVDGLAAPLRYSYGYKIIDSRVGGSNDRHDAPIIVGGDGPIGHNNLSSPDEVDGVFGRPTGSGDGLQAASNGRKPDESDDRRDAGPGDIPRALKPIVVKTESDTTKTELKKYYKKVTNPETRVKETKNNGKLTPINPANR